MNPSSPQSTESQTGSPESGATRSLIDQQVQACAADSSTQAEFLQRLAAEMLETFGVSIVAIESSQWDSPMMLVTDRPLAERINRLSICDLLTTAAVVPIASDIPLEIPTDDGKEKTRSLRVEFADQPGRSAALLIYSADTCPTPTEQLKALKTLNDFTTSIRQWLTTLPASEVIRDLTVSNDETGLASALRARQSLTQFHRDLDLDATAFRIANESRRLLDCDRTTVLVPRGSKFRVQAMSGVAVVDSRSNSIKSIERLTSAAVVMSRPMILPSEEPLPPQIQDPLDDYLDETGVMTAILLPLYEPQDEDEDDGLEAHVENPFEGDGRLIAVMMLEYFSGKPPESVGPATTIVASEAMYSLRNATEHRNVFGLLLWKSVGKLTHSGKFPLIATGFACCVALLIASTIIQVEHHVIATGSVEPTNQRQVFSNVDGVVKTIHVVDGQKVTAGEPLFQLENADLESRAESLSGEILTAEKRLASITRMRLDPGSETSQTGRMALEKLQLESELKNLRAQQALIAKQQSQLLVTSPIDGTVVGWQLDRRLSDRPVTRGNLLVRVVDHTGPWSLRLNIPDYEAGPILDARETESDQLPVRFAVATDPNASFAADLTSVATAARLNQAGEHVIDATALVNLDQPADKATSDQSPSSEPQTDTVRPASIGVTQLDLSLSKGKLDSFNPEDVRVGADVTARIACGKRSVMRSWFSDVFDFVDRNVMFYLR